MSIVPLTLLAVLSYTRARALVGADATAAAEAVDGLQLIILFILGGGRHRGGGTLDLRGQQRRGSR